MGKKEKVRNMLDDDQSTSNIEPEVKEEEPEEEVAADLLADEVDPYKEEKAEEEETYLNLAVMKEMDPYGEFESA